MSGTKILLVGPVDGRIKELVSKVSAIQAKHGPFSSLFIIGDLFQADDLGEQEQALLDGAITLPIKTYIFPGSRPLPELAVAKLAVADNDGICQLAANLFYGTHKSGVFVTPEGLRVAFCGGKWDPAHYIQEIRTDAEDDASAHMTQYSVQRLLANPSFALPNETANAVEPLASSSKALPKPGTLAAARAEMAAKQASATASSSFTSILAARPPVDLLLTTYWPTGVTLFASSTDNTTTFPDPTVRAWGCPPVAQLAAAACPRYHFALPPSFLDAGATIPVGIDGETLEMGAFWERAPYLNDLTSLVPSKPQKGKDALQSFTRFVSLARFGNKAKRRWFLALNLVPSDLAASSQPKPADLTQSPYISSLSGSAKRTAAQDEAASSEPNFRFEQRGSNKKARLEGANTDGEVPPPGYVCRICNIEGHYIRSCPSKGVSNEGGDDARRTMGLPTGLPTKPAHHAANIIPVGPENCWFCLSNPNIAKHLVVSIGSESYLVYPKGGFVHPSVNTVPGGGHVLLVPLAHINTLLPVRVDEANVALKEQEEEKTRIRAELDSFRQSLAKMYSAKNDNEGGHQILEWTLSRPDMVQLTHHQTQLLPVKNAVVDQIATALDERLSELEAQQTGKATWSIVTEPSAISSFFKTATESPRGYFHAKLGAEHEWLVVLSARNMRFPVQFVRSTLAQTLNLPDLEDWKACAKPVDEEKEDVATFRAHFAPFKPADL